MLEIELSNCQKIYNLNNEQKEKIRKDLTFKNPAYENILKYSKWGKTREPEFLHYYKETAKYIEVPVGYSRKHLIPYTITKDTRLDLNVSYPKPLITLRDLQEKAVLSYMKDVVGTLGSTGTIILPTGLGKSLTGVYLSYLMKQRTLIVVNKDDLVDGWTQDIKLCFGEDIKVGLVKGRVFKIGEQFTLTTIQTLSRLGKEKLDKLYENISMIICDETHKVAAKSYQVLLGFPAKYRLGLTATKMRNDGLVDVIDLLCGETVFDGTRELTEDIIPAHKVSIIKHESSLRWQPRKSYYNILTKQNVHNIKNGDLELYEGTKEWRDYCSELEAQGLIQAYPLRLHEAYSLIADDKAFNLQVAKDIKREYDNGKSCVVFCKTVEQLKKLYEILLPSCPKIQLFYGGSVNKAVVKEKAESKEVLITLATVSIACEGTNVKSWERGFLVSSVANEKDLIQILGRLRRTKQGKDSVIFYDYTFPNMAGIRNHWFKRKNWYKDLGCIICE